MNGCLHQWRSRVGYDTCWLCGERRWTGSASAGRPTDGARTSAESRTQTETETETGQTTSSLSAAQTRGRADETTLAARINGIDWLDALTAVTVALRPDWSPAAVRRALERDDRPRTVIAAAVLRARDDDVNHPNGLRYIGADHAATPIPPTLTEYRNAPRCSHGGEQGRCALCRTHTRTEEVPA